MYNKTLIKSNLKSNYKILLIIFGVLIMYTSIIIGMYDPESSEKLNQMLSMFPKEVIGAFGFNLESGSLLEFLTSYLYGFIYLIFPLIIVLVTAHRLIARHVDKGSMAYILATPNTRKQVAVTQMVFLEMIVIVVVTYITSIVIVCSVISHPGSLDFSKLMYVNLGLFLLHSALASVCYLGSCIANESKTSISIGVGVTVTFYVIQMLSNMSEKLQIFKYFTIFTLYQPSEIMKNQSNVVLHYIILVLIAVLCYGFGIYRFTKRDLPL